MQTGDATIPNLNFIWKDKLKRRRRQLEICHRSQEEKRTGRASGSRRHVRPAPRPSSRMRVWWKLYWPATHSFIHPLIIQVEKGVRFSRGAPLDIKLAAWVVTGRKQAGGRAIQWAKTEWLINVVSLVALLLLLLLSLLLAKQLNCEYVDQEARPTNEGLNFVSFCYVTFWHPALECGCLRVLELGSLKLALLVGIVLHCV